MESRPVILIVGTQPPESEEEWSTWYSEKHVPDVLRFKGVRKATRYRMVGDDTERYPKYLAIYEFENRQSADAYPASSVGEAAHEDWVNN
jgi:hypothetical protein